VTKELVEKAVVMEHNDLGDASETSELICELQLHYKLILNHKDDPSHARAVNRKLFFLKAFPVLAC
jgi:hypothetical protein